jgi:alkylhydroperoxidase family enzyme
MGHSEMLLAVAGLDKSKLDERTKKLSSTDWSSFPADERAGYFFAKKLSKGPSAISDDDFNTLVAHFGPVRVFDVIWWASRCHYMTRVADAFQIPLERENVFEGVHPAGNPPRIPR